MRDFQEMSRDNPHPMHVDGSGLRFAIVAARYNQRHVDDLLEQVLRTLDASGVAAEDVETLRVPGSNEVPYAAGMLAKTLEFDCVIALGLVMAGATSHHDVIAQSTAFLLQQIGMQSEVPVINGIVVVNSEEQARERCSGALNRGREFAAAALEMADIKRRLVQRLDALDAQAAADDAMWDDLFEEDDEEPWKR